MRREMGDVKSGGGVPSLIAFIDGLPETWERVQKRTVSTLALHMQPPDLKPF